MTAATPPPRSAVALLADPDFSAEALARECLDRIARRDPALRGWTWIDPPDLLRQARACDKQAMRGALHGIPVAVKDVIDVQGMPTGQNSPLCSGQPHAVADAAAVQVLRAAGALIFGKTDTTEFAAAGRNAATANPHDLARSPGGSSAGSAAVVADGHVPLALGTQTGGSVIRPAAFCGVFGFKPSWGLVSREGAKLYANSLDTIGWYARCVPDLALLADVFGIADDTFPAAGTLPGRRIGLCRPFPAATTAAANAALDSAGDLLAKAGARVAECALLEGFATLNDVHRTILFREGQAAFLPLARAHGSRLHADFHARIGSRAQYSNADLARAYDIAAQSRKAFDHLAGEYDAILAPSAPDEAPLGRGPGDPALNQIWTLLHVPVVNLPGPRGPAGLPLGVSVLGPRFADRAVLAMAEAIAGLFVKTGFSAAA